MGDARSEVIALEGGIILGPTSKLSKVLCVASYEPLVIMGRILTRAVAVASELLVALSVTDPEPAKSEVYIMVPQ